ncbi:hypothetical protein WJX72_008008 [[Myrmecia] bisecta]|uniref:protein O-GlcNAc transferase n=1 Tax=[Myrmecia] bisecta TaxID=41462 RepID=A0AAW1PKD7_9CHLO
MFSQFWLIRCGWQGDFVRAFASYSSALSSDPQHVETLVACAALYKSRNLLQEAVTLLTTAYAVQPADPDICHALAVVLTDLGTQLKQASKLSEGMTKYQEAVAICPTYAPAYYNIGVVHSESQQFEDALTYYQKAVDLNSHYAEPYCNIGVILKNQGRRDDAIAAYERALAAAPNFQIVQNNLAIALTELGTQVKAEGRLEEGIKLYERALSYNPKYPDAIYNLGVAFGEMGKLNRAIFMYEMCINFNPSCAEAFNNLGVILRECGNIERACDYYMAALQIRPNFPQGLNNLAVVYTAQGRSREALQMLQAAILASPDYAEAYNNLGVLQRDVGAVPEAIASYERCLRLLPGSRNAGQNRLLALNYIYPGEEHRVCAEHEEWGRQFQEQWVPLPRRRPTAADSDEQRQLVVGYISPDYFTHSVSYFAEVPLAHNSKGRFCTIAYSCVPKADEKTAHLQAAVEAAGGQWREVARLSEAALAQLIRDDKVDILVELTGHTAGNRLGTMALRPCPVQITWIGYPNTTGLKTVDYRFTDVVCDPLDTCQTFTEELIRLPGCFLCYTPPPDAPPVAPLPALVHGFVTFGSFNNLAKITPGVIGVWARVLEAVPSARLLLKNKPFACQSARGHVLELLERGGVQAQRVDLLPLAPANADHLATYAHMDISLDPFPYAGTTTTLCVECLKMY